MSTHGIGVFGINSKFASGNLVFYEKAVGQTVTGDVLTIGTAAVKVGGTSQDVDFQYYGTGSISAIIDCGATSFTITSINTTLKGTLTVGVDDTGHDVKLFGATASSYLLWDESDDRLELDGADINLQDNDILQFGDAQDVAITWDATNLTIIPATDNTGVLQIGNDGTKSMDVKFFGATASYGVTWDMNGDTNGSWLFGADDYGVDVVFYGQTASAAVTWDASADDLIWTGVARQIMGTSGTALVLTQGSPILDIYTTCASTHASNSVNSVHVKTTMTGAAGVGGRALFEMTTNVALGGWSNALKAYTEYGASGKTTGMGSSLCAEISLSAGTTTGVYAPLESEIVAPSGAAAGDRTSFLYMNASGDGVAAINAAAGYLFDIDTGVTNTEGGIFEAEVNTDSMSMTHVLKICISGTPYYIPLNTAKTF